jgi:hypothetical protein
MEAPFLLSSRYKIRIATCWDFPLTSPFTFYTLTRFQARIGKRKFVKIGRGRAAVNGYNVQEPLPAGVRRLDEGWKP